MIKIRELRKQDYKKARQFAIQGMHLYWYVSNKLILNLYARYFLDLELSHATRAYGAYVDDQFVGILLAEIKGEPKKYGSVWRTAYIRFIDWLQHHVAGDGVETYDKANQEMLCAFCEKNTPDGEIIFLAADPECKVRGIGTALLSALEKDEPGKLIYLYTDNACTYQFYEHRGFSRAGEQQIVMNLEKKEVPLSCFLYAKRLGNNEDITNYCFCMKQKFSRFCIF